MKAILIISHGSRSPETKKEAEALAARLKQKVPAYIVEYAFLELESPSIQEGLAMCVNQKADEILVLLNFLNSGKHVNEDIPRIVEESRRRFPEVTINITRPVGQHGRIIDLFLDMIT